MIQQKLIVGRFLNFPQPGPQPAAGAAAPALFDFASLQPMPLNIEESTGVFTKTSAVMPGAHASKGHRDFQWLEYKKGYITEVAMTNDIITGPMSGCPLFIYRRNGAITAGHVGTVDSDISVNNVQYEKDDVNDRVKQTWNAFAQANQADIIAGFNPLRALAAIPTRTGNDQSAPIVFGVMTTGLVLYSLVLYPQTNNVQLKRIAALQQVMSMSAHDMSHL